MSDQERAVSNEERAVSNEERAVSSVPLDTEDGDQVVIQQQNVGPGSQVGGGEFTNSRGRSTEDAEREQEALERDAPVADS